MLLDEETLRFVFGFKLRGLRQEKNLSLRTLSEMTGLSPSYLNEIEKGKKYPKGDKILLLARSLGVSYDDLTSLKLKKELRVVAQILGNNLIRGMPFDVFGIPAHTLFELMAEEPQNFSTLVGTILELARNHGIRVEDFFNATLRAYLGMNNNYFPDLEKKASEFREKLEVPLTIDGLRSFLASEHGYEIGERDFSQEDAALKGLYFCVAPGNRLFLDSRLSAKEALFILARECGYAHLGVKERLTSNVGADPDSFEALLGNFRAAYFASALLLPRDAFVAQLNEFIAQPSWDERALLKWVSASPAPVPAFFHRLSQVLPGQFGLDQIFFLRLDYDPERRHFRMLRELHLSELHAPHDVRSQAHYCQRWITTSLLEGLTGSKAEFRVGAQRSQYFGTEKEYLCFAVAFRKELEPQFAECVTIGIRVDDRLRARVKFLDDPAIPRRIVSDACEGCGVADCKERAAPPSVLEARAFEERREAALRRIQETPKMKTGPA